MDLVGVEPKLAIIPISKLLPDESFGGLLGTGFFVGEAPCLVTACHVFRDNPLGDGERYVGCLFQDNERPLILQIHSYKCSDRYDLAVVKAPELQGAISLPILTDPISCFLPASSK